MANNSGGPTPLVPNKFTPNVLTMDILDDLVSSKKPFQPCIVDLVTLQKLWFQTIPPIIKNNTESTWVALASPGRNLPFFQFGGAEKTLTFNLTWYSNHASHADVIAKCKWLESLSLADAYTEEPHPCKLIFGELYKDSKWIVKSAPYEISLYDRVQAMFPRLASQEVTLARISDSNPTRENILKYST